MADVLPGYDGELYYKVGGQAAGGSYVLLTNATDVTQDQSASEGGSTTRASKPYSTSEPLLIALQIDFEMIVDSGDTHYAAFRTAFYAKTMLGIQFYDENGGEGIQADYKIHKFQHQQPLDNVQKVSVMLKPCRSDTAPSLI